MIAPRRLQRDTGLLLVSNVGGAFFQFALTALIGRALGVEGLGAYAAALAWTFPLALLIDAGLGTLMTRDLSAEPDGTPAYLRAVLRQRLLFGGAAVMLLLLFAPLLTNNPTVAMGIRLSAPMVILLPTFSAFTAAFKARGRMDAIPILNIGMLAAQAALTLLVFLAGGGVLAALAVNTLTSAGQVVAAYGLYRRGIPPTGEATPLPSLRVMLRRGWPFALAGAFAVLQPRLAILLLETMNGAEAAGEFTAASRFVEAARLIPNAYFGALFPALAALAIDRIATERLFRRAIVALAGYGAIVGVAGTLAASLILQLVYGDDFTSAAPTLIIGVWSLLFSLLRGGRTLYWYAHNREQFVNGVNALTVGLQLLFSLWLIPAYGAAGAMLALLLSEVCALLLLWLPPRDTLIVIGLVIGGLALRWLMLAAQPFDGLYGQDSYAYYDFAGELGSALLNGRAPPPFFWGLGWPAALAATFSVFGQSPAVAQGLAIGMGVLLAPLMYGVARLLQPSWTAALIASLLMLVGGQALQSSLVVMADVPALFWVLCASCALLLYRRSKRAGWLIAGALAFTLAVCTRWIYGWLALPFLFWLWRATPKPKHMIFAVLAALIVALPQVAHRISSPFPLINADWVAGWSLAHTFQREFTTAEGTLQHPLTNAAFYAQVVTSEWYFPIWLLPFTVLGIFALRRGAVPLLLWVLLPYVFLIGIPNQNLRYLLIMVPPLCLFNGVGLAALPHLIKRVQSRPALQYALVSLSLVVALSVMTASAVRGTAAFITRQEEGKLTARWAADQIEVGAFVYAFNVTLALQHTPPCSPANVRELYYETVSTLAMGAQAGDYVFVNVWELQNQWQHTPLGDTFAYLVEARGLTRLGRHGNYTLFRIAT